MDANEKKRILDSIGLDNLSRNGLCVFAGAGISLNSGIPVVKEIKQYIINRICTNKQDREILMNMNIQFEAFMEIIFRNYTPPYLAKKEGFISRFFSKFKKKKEKTEEERREEIKAILTAALRTLTGMSQSDHKAFFELFGSNRFLPNTNHYLIAELLKSGHSKIAVTTNFDMLIEKAYKDRTGKDLPVYFPGKCKPEEYQFPCLLKLHGGYQDSASIQTTIENIASDQAIQHCQEMINYIFKTANHSTILIMGYSFSDDFDIVPAIRNIENPQKVIVNINYSPKGTEIHPIAQKSCLRAFKGVQINADTDKVVNLLQQHYKSKSGKKICCKVKLDKIICRWASNLKDPYYSNLLCGHLMRHAGESKKAVNYFSKCLKTKEAEKDKQKRDELIKHIRHLDPKDLIDKNIGHAKPDGDIQLAFDLLQQTTVQIINGEVEQAIKACNKALEIADAHNNIGLQASCYATMANLYNSESYPGKDYEKAIQCATKSLDLTKNTSSLEMQQH